MEDVELRAQQEAQPESRATELDGQSGNAGLTELETQRDNAGLTEVDGQREYAEMPKPDGQSGAADPARAEDAPKAVEQPEPPEAVSERTAPAPLDDEQRAIARRITADLAKIQVKYDRQFRLDRALEEDPDFRHLIFSGVSALEAYEMTQLPRRMAAEQAQRQQARRQARPQTVDALGKGETGLDFATMPDDQFARIEERLARGEKVYLDR